MVTETFNRRKDDTKALWRGLERIGVVAAAISAIGSVAFFAVRFHDMLDIPGRVQNLETGAAVSTATEKQFESDLIERIDRIERKIDKLNQ